jgi:hypothetical protein
MDDDGLLSEHGLIVDERLIDLDLGTTPLAELEEVRVEPPSVLWALPFLTATGGLLLCLLAGGLLVETYRHPSSEFPGLLDGCLYSFGGLGLTLAAVSVGTLVRGGPSWTVVVGSPGGPLRVFRASHPALTRRIADALTRRIERGPGGG